MWFISECIRNMTSWPHWSHCKFCSETLDINFLRQNLEESVVVDPMESMALKWAFPPAFYNYQYCCNKWLVQFQYLCYNRAFIFFQTVRNNLGWNIIIFMLAIGEQNQDFNWWKGRITPFIFLSCSSCWYRVLWELKSKTVIFSHMRNNLPAFISQKS